MICKTTIIISIVCAATTAHATLTNLGTVGTTYPIIEPDILVELKQKAGESDSFYKEQMLKRTKTYQPKQIHNLPRALTGRTFQVDMTYTLDRDLTDAHGKIIYPRGYTFNPLDFTSLSGGIVVIDAEDPEQLTWFETSPYLTNRRARLLLSGGYAFDLVRKLQRPVFYLTDDIATRLQLKAVPSLVIQQGSKIQVQEFYLPPARQGRSDED